MVRKSYLKSFENSDPLEHLAGGMRTRPSSVAVAFLRRCLKQSVQVGRGGRIYWLGCVVTEQIYNDDLCLNMIYTYYNAPALIGFAITLFLYGLQKGYDGRFWRYCKKIDFTWYNSI